MPNRERVTCQLCERHRDDVGPISWSGLCDECATQKLARNIVGISTRSGPEYARWVRRSFLAVQRRLVALEREGV